MGDNKRKFFLDLECVSYGYPYKASKYTKNLGVLEKYKGKTYTEKEINRIIAELMIKVPYVENAIDVELSVMYRENNYVGYYQILSFRNFEYKNQERNDSTIKFLYDEEKL